MQVLDKNPSGKYMSPSSPSLSLLPVVREVIPGNENVKKNEIRERVKEVQRSALKALSVGGSSYTALSQVAKTIEG